MPGRAALVLMSSSEVDDGGMSSDALVEHAKASERLGQHAEARRAYEQALHRMRGVADGRRASAILRWIARTHLTEGDRDTALECLEASIAVADAWDDDAAAGSAINVEAVIRWQLGELDEAERLYLNARARALKAGDAKLAAMTAQNLGVIANVRGDTDEARRHYEASLGEYRTLGLAKDVCVALNNLGLLHTQQERWTEAERVFGEAVQISDAIGDLSTRSLLDVNLAEMWVARQEFARAQQAVRHALDMASRTGDSTSIGQASKLLGVIAREMGNADEADERFRHAEEIAVARGDVLLEAEVARESGELARRQGRNADVLRRLNRAHTLFRQLRARRDLADIGRRTGRLEDEFLQVARRWGESIEAKDRYTQGHCVRVANVSCLIAADKGFETQELFWLRIGALLHDVGKLVIPEEVLNKPGKLTEDEWALMKSHTTAGVEMLSDIEFPWDVLPVVRSHHERWDGQGYPDRLKGEEIPLVARILCIADVYDALTSVRSYKRALTHDQAVVMMRGDVGTMFDPSVFDAFERVAALWPEQSRREPDELEERDRAANRVLVAPVAPVAPVEAVEVVEPREPPVSLVRHDDLTGLPLRRAFRETAERVLEARRTTERPVSLLVVDIDHFKLMNDRFGHLQGDDVLRMVAGVMRTCTRPCDFVARYAGDEFVSLLPGTSLEDATAIGERLRAEVMAARCVRRDGSDEALLVSLSIGVATAPAHGETLEALFAAADGALYASKRRGRNAVTTASGPGGMRAPTLLLDTFVGRAGERERLSRLLDASITGSPSVVSVVGEAGVGKSTLLRQLAPEVSVRTGSLIVGRCPDTDVRAPYGPWVEVIKAVHALELVPLQSWRELGRLIPALGAPDAGNVASPSSSARFALVQEIEEYLSAAAAARPLVVILDDMQWADAESWDVLDLLVPRLAGQRLLLCTTVRAEDLSAEGQRRRERLSRHECFTEIALGRLSRAELEHWLSAALGGQRPPVALSEYIATHTEGNPLFAVQMLRSLVDDGSVRYEDGAWRYRPSPGVELPTAVRDLLSRRIERLSQSTRDVLAAAAIFGVEFDADLLVGAAMQSEDVVLDALDEAVRTRVLTRADGASPTAFEFTHGLLADVLRRNGNPLRLRRVHERVARLLETQANADPAIVAAHFDRGGCSAETMHYARIAGERAMGVYAYDAASSSFEMAMRHAKSSSDRADLQRRLASLDEILGRYREAEHRCALILSSYASEAEELGIIRSVRRMRERLRLLRGARASDVLQSCEGLLAVSRASEDRPETVALLAMLSQVQARLGEHAVAERLAREAVVEAEQTSDALLNADAVMRLGSTLLLATPADALAHYRHALDIFTQLDDRRGQLRCHINVGVACDRAGNHHAAELSYATALELGREVKAADFTALASMNLGVLLLKTGRFVEARQRFEETLRLYTSVNDTSHRLFALYNIAHLARELGDAAGATELYGACVSLAERLGQPDVHVGALAGVGLAALTLGQFAAANSQLTAATELLSGRDMRWFQGRELLEALEIRLLAGRGDVEAATSRLDDVLADAQRHDQYAAVWLMAECADALRSTDARWVELTRRYAVHARALGYAPLLSRLLAADGTAAAAAACQLSVAA